MNDFWEYPLSALYFFSMNGIQLWLELHFFSRYTGRRLSWAQGGFYLLVTLAAAMMELSIENPSVTVSVVFFILAVLLLFCEGVFFLRCSPFSSFFTAVTAKTVTLLCNRICTSVTFLLAPLAGIDTYGQIFWGFFSPVFLLLLSLLTFFMIQKWFYFHSSLPYQSYAVFFLPLLLVIFMDQFIFNQMYGNEIIIENGIIVKPLVNHWQLLVIQSFAYLSLLSVLYACKKLSEKAESQTQLALLEQKMEMQQEYLQEAKFRYEQTRAFRHDIRGHLLALGGYIGRGDLPKASAYLQKLESVSGSLAPSYQTGNLLVDTLLNSKLASVPIPANKIECQCSLPPEGCIDDLDLCILFSNALDNARKACLQLNEADRYIHISSCQKGDFILLEFENSCLSEQPLQKGIGISNMEAVAQKYHGALAAEQKENRFHLSIMLVISRPLDNSSGKMD